MAAYAATILWERAAHEAFTDSRYGRGHAWSFDGGATLRASASPLHVSRWADPAGVDPEEAFVAALSSCHMLGFLYLAAKAGHVVDRYEDLAEGVMATSPEGRMWVGVVTLRPRVAWGGRTPDRAERDRLHHRAHEECFIANSVKAEVRCEPID